MPLTKTFRVTIEKEIEITFPDYFVGDEFISDWKEVICSRDDLDDIFKAAVNLIVNGYADCPNDGLGVMVKGYMMKYPQYLPNNQTPDRTISFDILCDDIDVEEVK